MATATTTSRSTRANSSGRAGSSTRPASTKQAEAPSVPNTGYLERSRLPLQSLIFLLPLLVAYEIGTWLWASQPGAGTEQRIIAFSLMREFFLLFGINARYLPPVAVVVFLLAIHVKERRSWEIDWKTAAGMAIESVAWAMPLLVLAMILVGWAPWVMDNSARAGGHPAPLAGWLTAVAIDNPAKLFVLAIGAGIYEELVFRLIGFALVSFVLHDLLRWPDSRATVATVLITAVAFSAYHYLGQEAFSASTFIFRMTAGIFFGWLYLSRGFGITAGSHAAYDVFVSAIAVSTV
jgi:membrane protease YdiL (CAAX protease family)